MSEESPVNEARLKEFVGRLSTLIDEYTGEPGLGGALVGYGIAHMITQDQLTESDIRDVIEQTFALAGETLPLARTDLFECPFCGGRCAAGASIDRAFAFLNEGDCDAPAVLHSEPVCEGYDTLSSDQFLEARAGKSTS